MLKAVEGKAMDGYTTIRLISVGSGFVNFGIASDIFLEYFLNYYIHIQVSCTHILNTFLPLKFNFRYIFSTMNNFSTIISSITK